ncbi:hypothetical protein ATM97_11875 [Nocardia sp. MH4]|uniref:DUF6802 family protein n=1 Tax=Nocardia TaxID=1817 RepID=UPI001C4FAEA9|nr:MULTISPECIES: DUF6802 family protein [Nocardia]MBW0271451.1 hypothetical protein [Nocardia sp. MH4]
MVTSGDIPGLGLPDIDAHSPLGGLGPVELHTPSQDLDGDGVVDSLTDATPHDTTIWSDYDHDGFADHVTVVEADGDYAAWEYHRHPDGTSEWRRTDQGNLGK